MTGALGYPFGLFGKRLISAAIFLVGFAALLAGIDVLFAMTGVDVVSENFTSQTSNSRGATTFYNLLSSLISVFAGALVMASALIDLKRRDAEERPSLGDGLSQIVLNIKYGFSVLLPAGLIFLIVAGVAGAVLGAPAKDAPLTPGLLATIAAGFVVFAAWTYVTVRLFIAWPMAIADGEGVLWRAWPKTRKKFWPLFGMIILVYVVGFMPLLVTVVLAVAFGITPQTPVTSLEAALQPNTLIDIVAANVAETFGIFYTAAAAASLYNSVDPSQINLADNF